MTAADGSDIEQVVLVDDAGRALGAVPKATVHTDRTPLHLGFSCYVVDPAGRMLLTTRAAGKTFGGVLTNAFCGHPAPGEPLESAVRRRAAHELGLELGDVRLLLPDFRYRAELRGVVENELCPVLLATGRGAPRPDPSEVCSLEWVSWPGLRDDVLTGRRAVSPWFADQIALLAGANDDPREWPPGDPARLPATLRDAG
ncbi:isopentenyl-diphosphate Delta-isomerase [Cumulibacter manganitolerans]|uniref:isopentenyl-diphosphate Delta-isomerase n=1 Tax=Cumulibacter manganitolerans TaxID=1884992 RepID=UPI001E3BA3D2|nr:isopentenyl-diphosphate Delta-isomerase [Cumulibacter manganitolerans]